MTNARVMTQIAQWIAARRDALLPEREALEKRSVRLRSEIRAKDRALKDCKAAMRLLGTKSG